MPCIIEMKLEELTFVDFKRHLSIYATFFCHVQNFNLTLPTVLEALMD